MRSMTGFGRAEGQAGASLLTVEVKSVNHRFLDVRFRLPYALSHFEVQLAELIRSQFERGSFDVTVKHKLCTSGTSSLSGTRFIVDETAAKSLMEAWTWLCEKFKIPNKPGPELFAMTEKVLIPVEEAIASESLFEELKSLLMKSLGELKKFRESEGTKTKVQLLSEIESLKGACHLIQLRAKEQPKAIHERLTARLSQWKLTQPVDNQRLEWEVALLAERSDITEELNRLTSHMQEFETLVSETIPVGRKLDFLTQEMHREVNTMGSKSAIIAITQSVVVAKATIEKLREQVQNVE